MIQKLLSSGWVKLTIANTSRFGGWAQIPFDYAEETIQDKYIFQPEWNRQRINEAWKLHQLAGTVE